MHLSIYCNLNFGIMYQLYDQNPLYEHIKISQRPFSFQQEEGIKKTTFATPKVHNVISCFENELFVIEQKILYVQLTARQLYHWVPIFCGKVGRQGLAYLASAFTVVYKTARCFVMGASNRRRQRALRRHGQFSIHALVVEEGYS